MCIAVLAGACATERQPTAGSRITAVASTTTTTTLPPAAVTTTAATTRRPTTTTQSIVVIPYRVEERTSVDGFTTTVDATLNDPRGWTRAGFRFERRADAAFRIIVAEGDEVDDLCRPYDTYGEYSCQNGPVVALNAERWREATPKWTGDVPTYRQMLVNHEVGHLLGMHHPEVQCPARGQPAPIMAQQSTELDGCLPNPWPLDHEIERAARHDLPLAPPFQRSSR